MNPGRFDNDLDIAKVTALTDEDVRKIHNAMYGVKDYEPYQLYEEAVAFGLGYDGLSGQSASYWTAWFAARRTAAVLLDTAEKAGVTPEQWEKMRAAAARVATD